MTSKSDDPRDTPSPSSPSLSDAPITEDTLITEETLDRSSPEIWGDDSLQKFVAKFHPGGDHAESPTWDNITPDDKKEIARLEGLNEDELMMMAKGLFDRAYFLEKEELLEMQKGKLLNIYNGDRDVNKSNLTS